MAGANDIPPPPPGKVLVGEGMMQLQQLRQSERRAQLTAPGANATAAILARLDIIIAQNDRLEVSQARRHGELNVRDVPPPGRT